MKIDVKMMKLRFICYDAKSQRGVKINLSLGKILLFYENNFKVCTF